MSMTCRPCRLPLNERMVLPKITFLLLLSFFSSLWLIESIEAACQHSSSCDFAIKTNSAPTTGPPWPIFRVDMPLHDDQHDVKGSRVAHGAPGSEPTSGCCLVIRLAAVSLLIRRMPLKSLPPSATIPCIRLWLLPGTLVWRHRVFFNNKVNRAGCQVSTKATFCA